MGLSASQGRLLLLTAKQSDLEFRAQQISQKRLVLAQQLEQISKDYEDATSNRVMSISMYEEGTDADGQKIKSTANLTYKNLISGTLDQGLAGSAGIATGVYECEAASGKAYRLVDPNGAIVVSSEDEIPKSISEIVSTSTLPMQADGKDTNVYVQQDSSSGIQTKSNYYVLATNNLSNLFSGDAKTLSVSLGSYSYTDANGAAQTVSNVVEYPEGTYYNSATGEAITGGTNGKFQKAYDATLVKDKTEIPTSKALVSVDTTTTDAGGKNRLEVVPGNDGYYTLQLDGVIKARYVVDTGLKSTSNAADPNYLQDCLRNGKYLIEQYNTDADKKEASWDKISWDATSNISDRYYTEDDAAAKAKYDRAQSEIQNADKKLELELDNVETQRNAVKTEIESVKKVENDNIEKSFNPFNA